VVKGAGLSTWHVSGPPRRIATLAHDLADKEGVEMVAPFGATLHVSGSDGEKLDAAVAPYKDEAGLEWSRGEPSLEDAFIHLMDQSQDNFAPENRP
jgi:ABC-2 type transport system ATP-binding protein